LTKKIIINKAKCIGCGLCVNTCHQGVIKLIDGKAELVHEDYCDGLGNCLPVCPVGAIKVKSGAALTHAQNPTKSQLKQWPCQIKLVHVNAPYFKDADLLVAADCCAYSYSEFHHDFIKNKITIIGCPKLDEVDYSIKLSEILKINEIKSITVARMEVPCCCGLENAVKIALTKSGKSIKCQVAIFTTDGRVVM